MAKNIPDIVGNRYGRWTVIGNADKCQSGEKKILCRCDCGTEKVLRRSSVTSGNSKSCGCYASEEKIKNATSHGCSRTRLYRIWAGIIQRCYNNTEDYEWQKYGGRGIGTCNDWRDFGKFKEWALSNGYNDKLTIDRIDNNGNYEPSNCRWATIYEQNNNKRTSKMIFFNGETGTVREFADKYGLKYSCLYARLKAGWDVKSALLAPSQGRHIAR